MISIDINNLPKHIKKSDFISTKMIDKNLDIEFICNSNFKNAKILRRFIEIICNKLWFSQRSIARFILIVDELNNNAIEYWTEKNWKNIVRLKTYDNINSIDVMIEIEDTWKWKKPRTALDMETLRAHQLKLWYDNHNSIRWRWLFMIIVKTVDRLYFRDSKTWWLVVWIKKNIVL